MDTSHSTEGSEVIGAGGITEGEEANSMEAKIPAQGSESNGDAPENKPVEVSEATAGIGGEQSHISSARSIENPPAKKIKITKEAEHLLTALPEKEKESIALLKTPAELLASFR